MLPTLPATSQKWVHFNIVLPCTAVKCFFLVMSYFKAILLKTQEEMEFLATLGLLIYLDICLCLPNRTCHCKVSYLLSSSNYSLYLQKFKCNMGKRMPTLKHLHEKQWHAFKHLFIFLMQDINKLYLSTIQSTFTIKSYSTGQARDLK